VLVKSVRRTRRIRGSFGEGDELVTVGSGHLTTTTITKLEEEGKKKITLVQQRDFGHGYFGYVTTVLYPMHIRDR